MPIVVDVDEEHVTVRIEGLTVTPSELDEFARRDGLASAFEFHQFWLKFHGIGRAEGLLIRWVPESEWNDDEA